MAGVAEDEVAALSGALRAARAAELLVFTRFVLVMTNFERSLYADPESDLDARWWDSSSAISSSRARPAGATRTGPPSPTACAPVYYHTYLYGQVVASQLGATLERECGGLVDRPAAGKLLSERVFAPGLSLRWDRLLQQATGEALTAVYLGATSQP